MSEYKSCDNCKHETKEDFDYPCCECKCTTIPHRQEWEKRALLWEPKADVVNHPIHYNQGKYECIEVMVETFGKEVAKHFCLLNAFKYIWRTGEKNGAEDVKKAIWYLDKFLELEGENHDLA